MTALLPREGASLLPHQGLARFVDEVVESAEGTLVCAGRVPVDSPFAQNGLVPGFVLLEFAAQAAAIDVLSKMGESEPRPRAGYLVRAGGANWSAAGVMAGEKLMASVRREQEAPPLYLFHATITLQGVRVFGGHFALYVGAVESNDS